LAGTPFERGTARLAMIHDGVRLELVAELQSVRIAREAVSRLAASCRANVADVALCVSEVVTNAILHAFRDRRDGSGCILVEAACWDGALHVRVADDGIGVGPRTDSPGLGMGLPLVSALASRLDITSNDPGVCVSMQFRLAG
jgi:anti-sigma regulatory factor (Ser/Thr protein kinase)